MECVCTRRIGITFYMYDMCVAFSYHDRHPWKWLWHELSTINMTSKEGNERYPSIVDIFIISTSSISLVFLWPHVQSIEYIFLCHHPSSIVYHSPVYRRRARDDNCQYAMNPFSLILFQFSNPFIPAFPQFWLIGSFCLATFPVTLSAF